MFSSHVYKITEGNKKFCFLPSDKVLNIAKGQQSRGADIAKIVTCADTEEELDANLETTLILKRELKIPSLFLCNGELRYKHRRLGPVLGACMFLVTENLRSDALQPTVSEAKKILKDFGYTDLP